MSSPAFRLACAGLLAGLLVVSPRPANAAAGNSSWLARTWQSDEGLPGNVVTGVTQTPDGYLWVETEAGLVQFDGVRFRPMVLPRVAGRRSPILRLLLRSREGNLWLGMDGALAMSLEVGGTNTLVVSEGMPNSQPVDIAQDRDLAVWIAFLNRTVYRIAGGQVKMFGPGDGLPGGTPCALASDVEGQLWFAQNGRVGVFRSGKFQTTLTLPEPNVRLAMSRGGGLWICAGQRVLKYEEGMDPVELGRLTLERPDAVPTVLLEDRTGALWIGTSTSGLLRFEDGSFEKVNTSHLEIQSLAEDREGDLWVGTGGGGLDRLRQRVLELQGTESGLPFESVVAVCEDASNGLWAATQDGVLAHWQAEQWSAMGTNQGWPGGRAACIAADPRGGLWIGTRASGLVRMQDGKFTKLDRAQGLAGDGVRALLVARTGDTWIGLDNRSVVQQLCQGALVDHALPAASRSVRAMAEDASGGIWMGTTDGSLFDFKNGTLIDETTNTLTPTSPIRCLAATSDGSVWIGYAGAGLGRWKDGHYTRVNAAQGLLDGHVSQMAADDRGFLWMAGNRGISRVWRAELESVMEGRAARVRSIIYGRDEGLSSLQANYGFSPGALRSRDGRIWFLMRTGLAVVHAKNVRDNLLPPPVVIEDLAVDGRVLTVPVTQDAAGKDESGGAGALAQLPPGHRKLDFDYTALSLVAPENVQFRYRLDGVDEDWVEAGTRRTASYPRLPAGPYRFNVVACNNSGIWNETGAGVGFTVLPFFWQTWSFRSAVAAGFTLGILALTRYVFFRRLRLRLRLLEQQSVLDRERARIAKDMHDDLGASLTQIALLGELAQQDMTAPPKAAEHIKKISGTARQVVKSLDEIVWAVNPRNDTLAHLIDYVGQFTVDFLRVPGIRCRFDLPDHPSARAIAADVRHNLFLVVKEALHNIVKHAGATEVWLRADVSGPELRFTVDDNGCGFTPPSAGRAGADGLRNMQQRMTEIAGGLRVESHPGSGTKVIIEWPWPREE